MTLRSGMFRLMFGKNLKFLSLERMNKVLSVEKTDSVTKNLTTNDIQHSPSLFHKLVSLGMNCMLEFLREFAPPQIIFKKNY